jgi:Kef-type K+ transport system membrane component KefB
VVGELIGGILLGPTFFGALAPHLYAALFAPFPAVVAARSTIIQLALLLFMFVAGREVDLSHLRRRAVATLCTSLAGMLLPFGLGFAAVLLLPDLWGARGDARLLAFFVGTAMSISALPVIARILMDLDLLRSDTGVVIMTAAALDDLIGWFLFAALLGRFAPNGQWIGVHTPLLAFLAGAVLAPRGEQKSRIVIGLVAPIYFASVGLRVDFASSFDPALTALVLLVACCGKIIGAGFGAFLGGMPPKQALAVGFGMNARGAMEIILATVALEHGVIEARLFVALVLMAVITSLLSGPVMGRLLRAAPAAGYNTGMENETVRVQLTFPLEQVKKPIIWHFAHDYGLMFSIRRANIDAHVGGFTVLELTGPRERISAALEWARNEGIEVSPVGVYGTDEWNAH